jgi:oligo-alginate lyase
MPEKLVVAILTGILMLSVMSMASGKQCSRMVTAEMRANALANVEKYDWAANAQKGAIAAAEGYLQLSDDELWEMIPSQELPRDIHTNKEDGCPKCANGIFKYGNYPWKVAGAWKLQCPNCGEVFPKNDFWAFYKSALDKHGFFHRELGDQKLLFNADHPDPKDPLHKLYVDDGYGMLDENGNKHRMIAYYNSWIHWSHIRKVLGAFVQAYVLTSDPQYAHKAAVMLDRLADVYPDMNFLPLSQQGFEHSHGGSRQGRILGCIWEAGMANSLASAYDKIFDGLKDNAELVKFCSEKSKQHDLGDKNSIEAICQHIEDHLLMEILISCKDGRIAPNTGGTHVSVINAAVALDRPEVTNEWLDYLFDPTFPEYRSRKAPLQWIMVQGIDRDGMGGENGGYGLGWTRRAQQFPDLLAMYPDYKGHDLVAEFPKLRQCFNIERRLIVLDAALPNIGDCGAAGTWGRLGNAATFAMGYRLYKDPELAALAWSYAGENAARLRTANDIYKQDPDALANEIAEVAGGVDPTLKCDHLGRYGQAYVQTESPTEGRALWIHYGYGKGHAHADNLNIGIYAKNLAMMPELGYPEYTGGWPKRHAWTANTISHNTLLINDQKAKYNAGGQITLFAVQPPLRAMDVDAKRAYSEIETYRRTVAMVDISDVDSYVFDVFRARGGKNHRLSYHGAAETASVTGIDMVKQATGTFAGPDVEFATLSGELADFYKKSGFTYLYDVARSGGAVDSLYTVDWKCEDLRGRIAEGKEPHIRLHALTACDEVATAAGDPPQNKRGAPRRLRYLLQSRLGEDMESQFVTVLEPYEATPFIKQVRRLKVEHDGDVNSVAAVAVELVDGTTDILISCEERTEVKVAGGIEFNGQLGMIRLVNDELKLMRMSNATRLSYGDTELLAEQPAYEGTVRAIDVSDPLNNEVLLDPPLPQDADLVGQTIHFFNDNPIDSSYKIAEVTPAGISTGAITIIEGFKDLTDYSAGYKYLVNAGDTYILPCMVGLDK